MDIDQLIVAGRGIVLRQRALQHVPRHHVDNAVRRGRLLPWLPGVMVDPALVEDVPTRMRAALAYASRGGRRPAWLSHRAALVVHNLLDPDPSMPIDVVTGQAGRLVDTASFTAHRMHDLERLGGRVIGGFPVVGVEWACASAWPDLPAIERRAPVICAIREGKATAQRLAECLDEWPNLKFRAELAELARMVGSGAHSEFEIWGLQHFFPPDLLARSVAQYAVDLGRRTVYIDRAFLEEMVAHELDGTRYHSSEEQRRRDRERDTDLAVVGYQTLRLDFWRAHREPARARLELREVLAMRRRQFGLPAA